MTRKETIRKELNHIIDQTKELMIMITDKDKKDTSLFGMHYQAWYTRSLPVVRLLAPDRHEEFVHYYESDPRRKSVTAGTYKLHDFVRGLAPSEDPLGVRSFDYRQAAYTCMICQANIILSLFQRVDDVVSDLESKIIADFHDTEIEVSARLIPINRRASGAIAGVVLERHLSGVAVRHNVTTRKKTPTIGDYNDLLKQHGVYDLPTYRKIQYCADIRNISVHNKQREPTEEETVELVQGVQKIIRTVF